MRAGRFTTDVTTIRERAARATREGPARFREAAGDATDLPGA
jgi:hypothetical protein